MKEHDWHCTYEGYDEYFLCGNQQGHGPWALGYGAGGKGAKNFTKKRARVEQGVCRIETVQAGGEMGAKRCTAQREIMLAGLRLGH